jgi:hypothetical protein
VADIAYVCGSGTNEAMIRAGPNLLENHPILRIPEAAIHFYHRYFDLSIVRWTLELFKLKMLGRVNMLKVVIRDAGTGELNLGAGSQRFKSSRRDQ